jgi:hypothetical protein
MFRRNNAMQAVFFYLLERGCAGRNETNAGCAARTGIMPFCQQKLAWYDFDREAG